MYKINGGRVSIVLEGEAKVLHLARLSSGEVTNQVFRTAVKAAFRGEAEVKIDSAQTYKETIAREFERGVRRSDDCLATLRNCRMRMGNSQAEFDRQPFWERWNALMAEWRAITAKGFGNFFEVIEGVRELKQDFRVAEEAHRQMAVAA